MLKVLVLRSHTSSLHQRYNNITCTQLGDGDLAHPHSSLHVRQYVRIYCTTILYIVYAISATSIDIAELYSCHDQGDHSRRRCV